MFTKFYRIKICSSSFHKNMHSLNSVNKRRHFNNTTFLSWYATLFIEILILNTERRNQKSIHGKEWMEMIWTLYCLRHSSVLGVLNQIKWNACFSNACLPCECQNLNTVQEEKYSFLFFFERTNKILYHTNR